MSQRDKAATTRNRTDLEIPDRPHCDLEAAPAFIDEGWVHAYDVSDPGEGPIYEAELDNGATIRVAHLWEPNFPLNELPSGNHNHSRNIDDDLRHGHQDKVTTYYVGDVFIDVAKMGRRWDGRAWEGGCNKIRVRPRQTEPPKTLLTVDAVDVDEFLVDSRGRITIGAKHAGHDVVVALLDVDPGRELGEGESVGADGLIRPVPADVDPADDANTDADDVEIPDAEEDDDR